MPQHDGPPRLPIGELTVDLHSHERRAFTILILCADYQTCNVLCAEIANFDHVRVLTMHISSTKFGSVQLHYYSSSRCGGRLQF